MPKKRTWMPVFVAMPAWLTMSAAHPSGKYEPPKEPVREGQDFEQRIGAPHAEPRVPNRMLGRASADKALARAVPTRSRRRAQATASGRRSPSAANSV